MMLSKDYQALEHLRDELIEVEMYCHKNVRVLSNGWQTTNLRTLVCNLYGYVHPEDCTDFEIMEKYNTEGKSWDLAQEILGIVDDDVYRRLNQSFEDMPSFRHPGKLDVMEALKEIFLTGDFKWGPHVPEVFNK